MKASLPLALSVLLAFATTAEANIVVTLGQTGADTVISYTGSLRVNELSVDRNIGGQGHVVYPKSGEIYFNGNSYADNLTYVCTYTSGSQGFGADWGGTWANTPSGNLLLVALERDISDPGAEPSWVGLPRYYASGSSISGSLLYSGKDCAALGIDPTRFNSVYTFANGETITLSSAIPEPSTCALLFGLGALGITALRRRMRTN